MAPTIDYFYSHVSPWSFLGHARLREIAARTGAEIAYWPVTVTEIFPKTGGLPLAKRAPERRAYRMMELKRWSAHLGVPVTFEPKFFPADDRLSMRVAHAAKRAGADLGALSGAFMAACWQEEGDVADPDTLRAIADAQGLEGAALLAAAETDDVAADAQAACDRALRAGCFGVPWYALPDEGFWGQDRLDLLESRLKAG